jgi:hypothetical protein
VLVSLRGFTSSVLVSLCLSVGVGLLCSAPAFAVASEAPKIEEASVTGIRDSSATLNATINPEEATTSYRFEYAPVGGSFIAVPEAGGQGEIDEGPAGVPVSTHLQVGLSPASEYQFRVTVENSIGSVTGESVSFTTQPLGGTFSLPDNRSWEMVSPPQKEGSLLGWILETPVQAAADGNAFTDWDEFQATEANPAGSAGENSILFERGASGWSSHMISSPHEHVVGISIGAGGEYRAFSENLSKGVLQQFGSFTPLSSEATEQTPYVLTSPVGGSVQPCGNRCFAPLVTAANTPSGTKFGDEPEGTCKALFCGPEFVGATPNLEHVVLASGQVLAAGGVEKEGRGDLYEWSDGKLAFVGSGELGSTNAAGGGGSDRRHAISDDGTRVFFNNHPFYDDPVEGLKGLLMRDTATGQVVRLDVPNSDAPPLTGEEAEASYMTASSDGSKAFFLDESGLTAESSSGGTDLYEYDVNAPEGEKLTDLSVDRNGSEPANAAMVLGASEDGSYVYFIAGGVLAPGAGPGGCGVFEAPGTLCNLYVSHDGVVKFIDAVAAGEPDTNPGLSKLPVRVSPNGQWLAFMSSRDLTGYDTDDAFTGLPDQEVYLFDAAGDKLVCASCNPTGARPVGIVYEGQSVWSGIGNMFRPGTPMASSVPPWTTYELGVAIYQSRYLSNSGRLFFDSIDSLSPQDVNGVGDVYEFEPPGVGSCGSTDVTFSVRAGGCIALISSGASNEESAFLDASETGGDVFFLTSAKLLARDFDNSPDIYDARECTATSQCVPPEPAMSPPCDTGESCKPSPSPQPAIFGLPSSATFSGVGNVTVSGSTSVAKPKSLTRAQKLARALRTCQRVKPKRKRLECRQRARRSYGKKAAARRADTSRHNPSGRPGLRGATK